MVLMKRPYLDNPIAVIFVVVAWPGVAYEIDFHTKSSERRKCGIVPVPDRSFLKSSRALPEPIWTRISRSRRWDTSRTPKSSQKIQKSKKSAIKLPIHRPSGWYVNSNPYAPEFFKKSKNLSEKWNCETQHETKEDEGVNGDERTPGWAHIIRMDIFECERYSLSTLYWKIHGTYSIPSTSSLVRNVDVISNAEHRVPKHIQNYI